MENPVVKFKKLHPTAVLPQYQTAGAVGMDLVWDGYISDPHRPKWFAPLGKVICCPSDGVSWFYTGLAIEVPEGYEAQVRPRSSTGSRGLIVVNSPGTIDSDFRGGIVVQLHALIPNTVIYKGERIAQLVIAPVSRATIQEVDELSPTVRGGKGFGSTGR